MRKKTWVWGERSGFQFGCYLKVKSQSVLELLSEHVNCWRKGTLKRQAGGEASSLRVVLRKVDMTLRAAGRKWRPVIWKDEVLKGLIYSSIF